MTYRSLLTLADTTPACRERTRVALDLARRLDCHLVGLAPTGLINLPGTPEVVPALADFAERAWVALRGQAEQAADNFNAACRTAGHKSHEAVIDTADVADSLIRHAHCSDLTVLTQADPSQPEHRRTAQMLEQVLLFSARPTLVLPYAGRVERVGRKALVAWDDSREAARAVSDALPLLRQAEQVEVVSWKENSLDDTGVLRSRLASLHQWLLWQGVPAEVRVETTSIGVADAMLSLASDVDADLIVMGAYGHSRLAERVLGGATRGLLATMTVPVLMSH